MLTLKQKAYRYEVLQDCLTYVQEMLYDVQKETNRLQQWLDTAATDDPDRGWKNGMLTLYKGKAEVLEGLMQEFCEM